jgi:uncharacterized protein (TIGR00251 family)
MKFLIKIKPGAKVERVKRLDESHLEVWVKEKPEKGKANERLIKIISDYFKIPKSSILLVAGFKSREKVVKIANFDRV